MKKNKYLLFFCLIATQIFSQNTIKSRVVNAQNTEGVAYAAVGLVKENIGISTDENGYFELISNINDDSLMVSCVGYLAVKISVSNLTSVVKLVPSAIELKTLIVKPKKRQLLEVNGFGKKNIGTGFQNNLKSIAQIAQFIKNTDGNLWYLKEINIARRTKTYLNKKQKTQFRVRFYDVDEKGKPNNDIYESILVTNESDKIIKIDVENKKMLLPQNGMFVAIEWIKIPANFIDEKYKTHLTVNGENQGRKEVNDKFYTPMVIYRKPYEKEKNCKVFSLNYKGEWSERCGEYPFDKKGFMNNLAIGVTVTD